MIASELWRRRRHQAREVHLPLAMKTRAAWARVHFVVLALAVNGCAALFGPADPSPDAGLRLEFHAYKARLARAVSSGRAGDVPDYDMLDDPSPDGVPGAIEGLARLALSQPANAELNAAADEQLVLCVVRFAEIYAHRARDVEATRLGGPWSRAEASLSAWLRVRGPALLQGLHAERLTHALFQLSGGGNFVPYAARWPGFDLYALGERVALDWVKGGHVDSALVRAVVCPVAASPPGHLASRYGSGEDCGWFRQALADGRGIDRLAYTLNSLDDPGLTDAVFANLADEPIERLLALWRATSRSPQCERHGRACRVPVWHVAAVSIIERLAGKVGLEAEGERLWAEREERGVALYLMIQQHVFSGVGYPQVYDWDQFAAKFGAPVDEASFEAMMKESPLAVGMAPRVWPALSRDFPHVWPVLRHLDAFLDDPRVRAPRPTGRGSTGWPSDVRGSAESVLDEIHQRVCEDGDPREDAAWKQYLSQRVSAHPTDKVDYAALVSLTDGCRGPRRRRAAR